MSKIYEALRQAELDRAKGGATQVDPATDTPGSAAGVLDNTAFTSAFTSGAKTWATVQPIARAAGDKPQFAPFAGADLTSGATEAAADLPNLDLTSVQHLVWNPLLGQLPALEERGSQVEQFRSLRSRMQEFRDLNYLKTLMISSGLPKEGKSFVAVNLAISFARHKAGKVLLIDGDMRRATLHERLGAPQGPGLTEYLAGNASITEIMQRPKPDEPGHPLPHGLASLTFIPAGDEYDKAADLSGNSRFGSLIAAVVPHFDWIVVDSSPVNLVSDGVNLARSCDAVLLVARGGITKFEVAQRAVAELKAAKVLGFVLNAVKNPPVAGGYYGYDGYDGYDKIVK